MRELSLVIAAMSFVMACLVPVLWRNDAEIMHCALLQAIVFAILAVAVKP